MIYAVKLPFRNILKLFAAGLLIICIAYLLQPVIKITGYFPDLVMLTIAFTLISIVSLYVFLRGQLKEAKSQTMHTLVSLSIKFLLELTLAVLWFLIAKKASSQSVLMFFVLYLTFSLLVLFTILSVLKNKTL